MKILDKYHRQLKEFQPLYAYDPHTNPIKLLAYRISEDIENGVAHLESLENAACYLNKSLAQMRGRKIAERAGLSSLDKFKRNYHSTMKNIADAGFSEFQKWAETSVMGLVVTAHPTFSLTNIMGELISSSAVGEKKSSRLKAENIIKYESPTLKDEHSEALRCIENMQASIDNLNDIILRYGQKRFPKNWAKLSPNQVNVATWVGYDLDGRNDITWQDTIRLKLHEKNAVMQSYLETSQKIHGRYKSSVPESFVKFISSLKDALEITNSELEAFNANLADSGNLSKAIALLTCKHRKKWHDNKPGIRLLDKAIDDASNKGLAREISLLRSRLKRCGMGVAAIHLRANARQVFAAISEDLTIDTVERLDSRTLLKKLNSYSEKVKKIESNFSDLELENSTVRKQFILVSLILKYIDREMPLRYLIAETDQASIMISALALAKNYGISHRLDISPLFETPNALRNGGRVVAQALEQSSYRAYLKNRKVFCLQTGFSDAGRFIGQIAATLSIERLQSHVAQALAESGLKNIQTVIFNTHGESIGRGGHPGSLKERIDYVMSPWVFEKFKRLKIPVTHEISFQGGDGYLWFSKEKLAKSSLLQIMLTRFQNTERANDDIFYSNADFIWDFHNEIITQQDSLYSDADYRYILSGFARNFLIPSGSRPEIRQASRPMAQSNFTPRMIRAIPHNAILQQLSIPANVIFGIGRAMRIDPNRANQIFSNSSRGRNILNAVLSSWENTNFQALTAYGELQDPNFWISRAITGKNISKNLQCRVIANSFYERNSNSKLRQLVYRLRADGDLQSKILQNDGLQKPLNSASFSNPYYRYQILLHAIRLTALMHAKMEAASLPVHAPPGATRDEVMQVVCSYDLDRAVKNLKAIYPGASNSKSGTGRSKMPLNPGKKRDIDTANSEIISKLSKCNNIVKLVNHGLTHLHGAYG